MDNQTQNEVGRVVAVTIISNEKFRAALRLVYTLAVLGGCSHLVFWRGESGWLFLVALGLVHLRRGI